MNKTAWVAGASGLIGRNLIRQLCAHPAYDKVVAFVRQPITFDINPSSKLEQWQVEYTHLDTSIAQQNHAERVDDLFCALGSTRKKTPDPQQFYQIDVVYPEVFAKAGKARGAKFLGVVSAHGANRRAWSRYFRMKGDMEAHLGALDFERLCFARPGLLKGDRDEFRLLEKVAEGITNHLPGNYQSIQAEDVATALIHQANPSSDTLATKEALILESRFMQQANQIS